MKNGIIFIFLFFTVLSAYSETNMEKAVNMNITSVSFLSTGDIFPSRA